MFSKHNILRSFSIPGVWPLDPLCVLREWKGFEAMPSGLPDKLLSIATTLAKDLRAKQDKAALTVQSWYRNWKRNRPATGVQHELDLPAVRFQL